MVNNCLPPGYCRTGQTTFSEIVSKLHENWRICESLLHKFPEIRNFLKKSHVCCQCKLPFIHPSHGTFCTRLVWCPGGDYIAKQKKKAFVIPYFFFYKLSLKRRLRFFYCLLRECEQPNPADDLKDPGPVSSDKSVHFSWTSSYYSKKQLL